MNIDATICLICGKVISDGCTCMSKLPEGVLND